MLDEFIIPIMSKEGITELLSVLREEVITGEKSSDYLSHSVSMGFERRPPMNGSDGLDDNFKRMQHINMLKELIIAMKEDIREYGLDNYLDLIRRQYPPYLNPIIDPGSIIKLLTPENIEAVMAFDINKIRSYILSGNKDKLPKIISWLYNLLSAEYHVGQVAQLPYVIKKPIPNFINNMKNSPRSKRALQPYSNYYFRVYLNNSNDKRAYSFYGIFVSELIKRRIPFDNKFNFNETTVPDTSIFYFPTDFLGEVITILDEIGTKRPDLVSGFGTPPICSAQKSYYGICNVGSKNRTYNGYFSDLARFSFLIYICFGLKMRSMKKLSPKDAAFVNKYLNWRSNESICNAIRTEEGFSKILTDAEINSFLARNRDLIININYDNLSYYSNTMGLLHSFAKFGDFNHANVPFVFNSGMLEEYNRIKSSKFDL